MSLHSDFLTPQHIRLIQSMADFQMALSAADFMTGIDNEDNLSRVERRRYRCFEDAAVIAYGRAFTKANGLPALAIRPLGLKMSMEEKDLHERLMEQRQKVVAHSDADRQRILFATEKFTYDHGKTVMIPHHDFDDALHFHEDRFRLIEWLKKLIHACGMFLFKLAQDKPEVRFIRDHTITPPQ